VCRLLSNTLRATDMRVLSRTWPEHGLGDRSRLLDALADHHALCVRGVLSRDECAQMAAAVRAASADFTPAFGGEQFSLGRAWYTHYEEDLCEDYFAQAASSDALVERHLPGKQRFMMDFLATLAGGEARQRPGWCGPGAHVFPAGDVVAQRGGVTHFDTEGLAQHHIDRRKPAVSLLIMLDAPETGGGIRIWDVFYAGEDEVEPALLEADSSVIHYEPGDAVVFDSYRLHQIQPFGGSRERITLTAHAAEVDPGRWEVWF